MTTDLKALRLHLRSSRLSLSARERTEAESAAAKRLLKHPRFQRANRIAAYIGSNGELNPMPLLEYAADLNKECYLPVLHPFRHGQLWFCRWQPGDKLIPNRFDIPEPIAHAKKLIAARNLDLAIVPLLGFDSHCHRLGMGGGYYDRTFAFLQRRKVVSRPFLLGLAHEIQKVERLDAQPWDIALDAVITNHACYER